MEFSLKFTKVATIVISLLGATVAQAHNVWIERSTENTKIPHYLIKFGHETTEPYSLSKLTSVSQLFHGKIRTLSPAFNKMDNNKGEAIIAVEGNIVFIEFNNGIWSKLPSGKYVEKTKKEAPDAEFSINPMKVGKAILSWDDGEALKAHQQAYELVPQSEPVAGKPLAILVLKNGKPVKGIKVGLGEDKPFNLTNEQGIAYFTPTVGFNKVWAEFEEKVADNPDYTDRSYEYMLTFEAR
ncbi:MAG: DUF4198 domain-containing protein [[Actinobacillus] rossii]|uniref:Periplasmic binding protein CbiK n=1 Tax=[Actinobacillus] rossii TaxID=123820 RepID=A0A380U401_9PAST|nr:DUF4198 domain-containing protein [[Actinobacillus] rossii]MDD7424867.1 DUF4198 domain-containing protein [[Actinobacillus] rossii]MDY3124404.1 DUF4198 domain-containing protein [[Actinobacillus] rossii]MDY4505907.1 DUF4198 domain-containing protein [[Actinobacillus] rossii]SUT96035.1 periplasmic binding protein CbiK [[Actinobacillus] rossii]